MPVVPATDSNIRRAAEILRSGGLVAFPTETVYGLGANALSGDACGRIFEVKQRPHFDPLIVHVMDSEGLVAIADFSNERGNRLAKAFWPGPLTLVVPKRGAVPSIVTAGLPTVAVRVPEHPVAQALLAEAGCPVAAPSANPFGYISPTLASHVEAQLGAAVELVLDGGPTTMGIESTIVDLTTAEPTLLRPGAIEAERIEAIVGKLARAEGSEVPTAPGQLASHYAPRARVQLLEGRATARPKAEGVRLGLLSFGPTDPAVASTYAAFEALSPAGDLRQAAANLFACLHRLDRAELSLIHAEPLPRVGLGVAILDRLERAAARPRGKR